MQAYVSEVFKTQSPVLNIRSNLFRSKENIAHIEDSISKLSVQNEDAMQRCATASGEEIMSELRNISRKLETLTKTVLYMEKRMSLMEDQVKLMTRDA